MSKKTVVKIKELIKKNQISLEDLSNLSGIEYATLWELANNKRQIISSNHIERIAEVLRIKDIREIIDFIDSPDQNPCSKT
ncbi:helix-turn-helix transcriptional regulator [Bacillus sp. EB600]|uniref:helix-turn-helix domain-containing protein n=1 Tax=Bacillus sp. EB600 TaxID=2806345 RepID=UPI00210BA114|nr:helix-turn-helix transcriptional regulator [Bacillus sp. EB600]MCQ6280254.1 helix-turn-helix transcriptional regulator [Bacillus sp. EB600]